MDIETQTEIILREGRYETWPWTKGLVPVVCFENEMIVGFVHTFPTTPALLGGWEQAQKVALSRYAPALRAAGLKAWNVYSIFLTGDSAPLLAKRVELIEEDFSMTRKIARTAVRTAADLRRALLPVMPLQSAPVIGAADYHRRLRGRMKDLPAEAVSAFLGPVAAGDVVRILTDAP